MAYQCKHGGGECDGCGSCEEKPVLYDCAGEPIYAGEKYYDFGDGDIVRQDDLSEWVKQFLCEARGDD